jgi:hypothetical protein
MFDISKGDVLISSNLKYNIFPLYWMENKIKNVNNTVCSK